MADTKSIATEVKEILVKALDKAFPAINSEVHLGHPQGSEFGDYASAIALHLAHDLGKSPREIAQKIIENIPKNSIIEKTEIAGPGFINFFIQRKILDKEVDKILKLKQNYGSSNRGKTKTIVMDYSSPNIAKPLGVHHLLSTVIGQSLYNIYEKLGYKCVAINHLGDWGTQFGKLIYAYKKWGNKSVIEKNPTEELLKLYIKFHAEAEKNIKLEDEARAEFKKLESGDKENHKLWKWFVDCSTKDLQKTYKKLGGIRFNQIQGESFYEDKMDEILKEGKDKGIFEKGLEGAYVVNYADPNIAPFVVQKKDGTTLYSTRDFATLKYRIKTWKPEKILYVVDVAQTLHFIQLFTAAERFPWYKGEGVHVMFGRMQFKDKKMSTRTGDIILLDEVLDEAKDRALKVIEAKSPDLKDKKEAAEIIGKGAVKYNILVQNRTTNIVFDWEKMLSLDSNSAPYLQYTYARAKSILRKSSEIKTEKNIHEKQSVVDTEEKTKSLIRLFPQFEEHIQTSAKEYKPNILCTYLYELAQKFNSFYNGVQVLRAEKAERDYRLKIVQAAAQILKNGLELLGVDVVEKM